MKHGFIVIPLVVAFWVTSCCNTNNKIAETQDFSAHYFFDTVASLGTEVIIHYKNNRPVGSSILINEEKSSTMIQYLFLKDSILVSEEIFYYNDSLSIRKDVLNEVFWKDDTDSVNFFRYIIDYDGAVIWKSDSLNEIKNHYSLIDSLLIYNNTPPVGCNGFDRAAVHERQQGVHNHSGAPGFFRGCPPPQTMHDRVNQEY